MMPDIVSILERYLKGQLTSRTIEQWANAVRQRSVLERGTSAAAPLRAALRELANPERCGALTPVRARRWASRLAAVSRALGDGDR